MLVINQNQFYLLRHILLQTRLLKKTTSHQNLQNAYEQTYRRNIKINKQVQQGEFQEKIVETRMKVIKLNEGKCKKMKKARESHQASQLFFYVNIQHQGSQQILKKYLSDCSKNQTFFLQKTRFQKAKSKIIPKTIPQPQKAEQIKEINKIQKQINNNNIKMTLTQQQKQIMLQITDISIQIFIFLTRLQKQESKHYKQKKIDQKNQCTFYFNNLFKKLLLQQNKVEFNKVFQQLLENQKCLIKNQIYSQQSCKQKHTIKEYKTVFLKDPSLFIQKIIQNVYPEKKQLRIMFQNYQIDPNMLRTYTDEILYIYSQSWEDKKVRQIREYNMKLKSYFKKIKQSKNIFFKYLQEELKFYSKWVKIYEASENYPESFCLRFSNFQNIDQLQKCMRKLFEYDWSQVIELEFSFSQFSDSQWKDLLKNMGRFPNLKTLKIYQCDLFSVAEEDLKKLSRTKIKQLNLNENPLTVKCLETIQKYLKTNQEIQILTEFNEENQQ